MREHEPVEVTVETPAIPTNRQKAESWVALDPTDGQVYALLAVADAIGEAQAAQIAAVAQAASGVVGPLTAVATAILGAFTAQTEAIRRVAELFEHPPMAIDTMIDTSAHTMSGVEVAEIEDYIRLYSGAPRVDVEPPVDVNTLHAAERLRMRLDRARTMVETRRDQVVGDGRQALWLSRLLRTLDGVEEGELDPEPRWHTGDPRAATVSCPAHGVHPHGGLKCLDCPQCNRPGRGAGE